MSDRGIPYSYRHMHGFGSHTFSMFDHENKKTWVKFHWVSLQGRLFSYGDAQRYRLGVNHHQIPVNRPKNASHSYHRDGAMRLDGNHGGLLHYNPNSYGEWDEQPEYKEPPMQLESPADHWDHHEDEDYYSQPRRLFHLMNPEQKKALYENTARNMGDAPKMIKIRHIKNCGRVEPEYAEGVAKALGICMSEVNSE